MTNTVNVNDLYDAMAEYVRNNEPMFTEDAQQQAIVKNRDFAGLFRIYTHALNGVIRLGDRDTAGVWQVRELERKMEERIQHLENHVKELALTQTRSEEMLKQLTRRLAKAGIHL